MPQAPPVAAVPGCKSATQRALLLAAVASGESRLAGPAEAQDCVELRDALRQLGVELQIESATAEGGVWTVQGGEGPPTLDGQQLQLGAGASTLRFLLPLCAASTGELRLTVVPALRERPHQALFGGLAAVGAALKEENDGWSLRASGFQVREAELDVAATSQVLSGFLMASGAVPQRWSWRGMPVSAGYLAMTIGMQRVFRGGDALAVEDGVIEVAAGFGAGRQLTLPGDASGVLALAVGVLLSGRPLALGRRWSTRHPDAAVLLELQRVGLLDCADAADGGVVLSARGDLADADSALALDVSAAPDAAPALAALGLHLPGGLRLHGAPRLRGKESDRLERIEALVALAGGVARLEGETLHLAPATTAPSSARSYNPHADHRMAMAAGLASLRDPGLEVENRSCVAKSFPAFWEQLELLV